LRDAAWLVLLDINDRSAQCHRDAVMPSVHREAVDAVAG
jgi:hypothetical protein